MTMAINGNNIIILRDGTAIAGTKSHEIQVDSEMIEISSPSTGIWRQYISGRKEWSITVSYLLLAAASLGDVLNVGTSYTLIIRDRSNTKSITGTAILKTCKQTYTRGNLVVGSFQFIGNGSLS